MTAPTSHSQRKPVWMTGEKWECLLGILDGVVEGVLPASPIEVSALASEVRAQIEVPQR